MILEFGHEYFRFHTQGKLYFITMVQHGTVVLTISWSIAKHNNVNYYSKTAHSNSQPPNATNWYAMLTNPIRMKYHIHINKMRQQELFDVNYVQSADVITLVHPSHAPRELRRLSATQWELRVIDFGSPLQPLLM